VPEEILRRAAGFKAVCIFVNKKLEADVHGEILKSNGNQLILCCSAGFDNVSCSFYN
jgi:lactate dehydrogenase-like 2-hydroxyacid dehydrogenase